MNTFIYRRLQNILTNHEENIRKLTNKLCSNQDLEAKVKSFFGENEEFYKKKAQELTKQNQDLSKKLAESEKSRFERVLEESDTSRVKAEVEKLTGLSDNILSKTEQVFAVVQGLDMGSIVRSDGKGKSSLLVDIQTTFCKDLYILEEIVTKLFFRRIENGLNEW